MTQYQQGDVLFEAVKIPKRAKLVKDMQGIIVAQGEATGHMHVVQDRVQLFQDDGLVFLKVPQESRVVHEEHKPITLPPGEYRIKQVQEYDHLEELARTVRD